METQTRAVLCPVERARRTLFQCANQSARHRDAALHVLLDQVENGTDKAATARNLINRARNQNLTQTPNVAKRLAVIMPTATVHSFTEARTNRDKASAERKKKERSERNREERLAMRGSSSGGSSNKANKQKKK